MINPEKKQFVEMGEKLRDDLNGTYRKELKNKIFELRKKADNALKTENEPSHQRQIEALQRAFMIADRILEKVFLTPENPELLHSKPQGV